MSRARADLTAGDYAFLGFLARGLTSAYEVKKAMSGSISFFWAAAHSQIYQHAARLVALGYIREREAPGVRRKKTLSLTPKGRGALRRWLREPAESLELRDEMLVKVFFAEEAGDASATAGILEQQRAYLQTGVDRFGDIREMLVRANDPRSADALATLELGLDVLTTYLRWIERTIPRYAARETGEPYGTA